MSLLDFIPVIGPALDAAVGLTNQANNRSAFTGRYQDTVTDMKKAGLNPALAYGQGGGNPQTEDIPNIGQDVTNATGMVQQIKSQRAKAQSDTADTDLTNAQAGLLKAQTADLLQTTHAKAVQAQWDAITAGHQSGLTGINEWNAQQTSAADIAGAKAGTRLKQLQIPEANLKANAATGAAITANSARSWWDTLKDKFENMNSPDHFRQIGLHKAAVAKYQRNHP